MYINELFLKFKKIYIFISIIFKEIILNKGNNGSRKSLFYCWTSSFFSTCIIILINAIINGFYSNAIESVKILNGDLTIAFNKNITFKESNILCEKIKNEKSLKIDKIFFFGIMPLFLYANNKLIPCNFLILNTNFFQYLKNKLNLNFEASESLFKNREVLISFNFEKKHFLKKNKEYNLINSGFFDKNTNYIKCKKIPVKINNFINLKSDELIDFVLFFNGEDLEKKYNQNLINNIVICLEKNTDIKKKIIIEKINNLLINYKNNFQVSFLEENYFDFFKIMKIQLYSGYLILFFLSLFSILIIFNTLSIFIEQKKKDFLALYLQGFDFNYLNSLILFLIFFSSTFLSFLGGIIGFIISYFLNYYKILKFNYISDDFLFIPFIPKIKILFFCIFLNFIISIYIYKKSKKNFDLKNLNEIINE